MITVLTILLYIMSLVINKTYINNHACENGVMAFCILPFSTSEGSYCTASAVWL